MSLVNLSHFLKFLGINRFLSSSIPKISKNTKPPPLLRLFIRFCESQNLGANIPSLRANPKDLRGNPFFRFIRFCDSQNLVRNKFVIARRAFGSARQSKQNKKWIASGKTLAMTACGELIKIFASFCFCKKKSLP